MIGFWTKVAKAGPDECWLWTGARRKDGYGHLRRRPLTLAAHRVAYALANDLDPISFPSEIVIRHKCDVRACCNPAHLEAGTQKENIADCFARGRANVPTKISRDTVEKIRQAAGTQREIAARFNVSQSQVCDIRGGKARTKW